MSSATTEKPEQKSPSGGAPDRFWYLRIWSGMLVSGWFPLLWRNRFDITPTRIGMAMALCMMSVFNSLFRLLQLAILGRRIERTEIVDSPVFVLGHWRSGTTLLHELLVSDPRHTYPDTFSCFAPNHFLLTAPLLKWWLKFFMPPARPMDNMRVGWDNPQEDEWAMCNMAIPSPYLSLVFPHHPPQYQEYLDLREVPAPALERWKRAFVWFLKSLTFQSPKRIVLKSPQHTCRVKTLLEIFPDARFVHIARDPYVIFPSTVRTWIKMSGFYGLQKPKTDGWEDFVFDTFVHMYNVFEEDRKLLRPSQFCELRYEDLVRDPVGQMEAVYRQLELGDFETVRPAIEAYAQRTKDYKVNRYELDPAIRDRITERWSGYIKRYGYGEGNQS